MLRGISLLLPKRVGASAFLQVLGELRAKQATREIALCWRQLHKMAPTDTDISLGRILAALESGCLTEAAHAMEDAARAAGIPPRNLVNIAGQLAVRGHFRSAGQMINRVARLPAGSRLIAQSPSIVSARIPKDLEAFGSGVASAEVESSCQIISFARLCFSSKNFAAAAALYKRAELESPLDSLDRVAMIYALSASDLKEARALLPVLHDSVEMLADNVAALGVISEASIILGATDIAREAMLTAILLSFGDLEGLSDLLEDCLEALKTLADLRCVDERIPEILQTRIDTDEVGVPKVFICGFGWSGSGAVYDEIRGASAFCEFEGAGRDSIINEDADSEATFVQGPGGLGDLWKRISQEGNVPWKMLWQTFSLHMIGLSSTGYVEYKSCAAARANVRRYGAQYTRPFRQLFEGYAAALAHPEKGALHSVLMRAAESLCAMLVGKAGADAVLFNNAIFGRDPIMFEIFRCYRAVVVYRDPRDVYVDRKKNDRNHWRTVTQASTFYAHSLHRYRRYKLESEEESPCLREVSFERFVEDEDFRRRVCHWLLWGLGGGQPVKYFDAKTSIRNIGIYNREMGLVDRESMFGAFEEYLAMHELSDRSWQMH